MNKEFNLAMEKLGGVTVDFSITALNAMFELAREKGLKRCLSVFYNDFDDWGLVFEDGDTVVSRRSNA